MESAFSGAGWHENKRARVREGELRDSLIWPMMKLDMMMEKLARENINISSLERLSKPQSQSTGRKQHVSSHQTAYANRLACIHYNVHTLPSVPFNSKHFNPLLSIF